MATVSSPAALPQYIEKLLSDRHAHVSAIGVIDATLERVTAALGHTGAKPAAPKPVVLTKPAARTVAKAPVAKAPVMKAMPKASATKPVKSGLTANEFVIEFIKAKKNPTSQEINKYWKESGRNGVADNSLSLLTKSKMLKRTPLGGGLRGSRYSVA